MRLTSGQLNYESAGLQALHRMGQRRTSVHVGGARGKTASALGMRMAMAHTEAGGSFLQRRAEPRREGALPRAETSLLAPCPWHDDR